MLVILEGRDLQWQVGATGAGTIDWLGLTDELAFADQAGAHAGELRLGTPGFTRFEPRKAAPAQQNAKAGTKQDKTRDKPRGGGGMV